MIVTFEDYLVRDFPTKENGNKAVGVPVWVYVHGSDQLASIYDKNNLPISNPVITDERGNYSFKIEEGFYDFKINVGTDLSGFLYEDKIIFGDSVFIDSFDAYEVPPFNGNQFVLPRVSENIFVTINGRGVSPSDVVIYPDGVTVNLIGYSVTTSDEVVARVVFADSGSGSASSGVASLESFKNNDNTWDEALGLAKGSVHTLILPKDGLVTLNSQFNILPGDSLRKFVMNNCRLEFKSDAIFDCDYFLSEGSGVIYAETTVVTENPSRITFTSRCKYLDLKGVNFEGDLKIAQLAQDMVGPTNTMVLQSGHDFEQGKHVTSSWNNNRLPNSVSRVPAPNTGNEAFLNRAESIVGNTVTLSYDIAALTIPQPAYIFQNTRFDRDFIRVEGNGVYRFTDLEFNYCPSYMIAVRDPSLTARVFFDNVQAYNYAIDGFVLQCFTWDAKNCKFGQQYDPSKSLAVVQMPKDGAIRWDNVDSRRGNADAEIFVFGIQEFPDITIVNSYLDGKNLQPFDLGVYNSPAPAEGNQININDSLHVFVPSADGVVTENYDGGSFITSNTRYKDYQRTIFGTTYAVKETFKFTSFNMDNCDCDCTPIFFRVTDEENSSFGPCNVTNSKIECSTYTLNGEIDLVVNYTNCKIHVDNSNPFVVQNGEPARLEKVNLTNCSLGGWWTIRDDSNVSCRDVALYPKEGANPITLSISDPFFNPRNNNFIIKGWDATTTDSFITLLDYFGGNAIGSDFSPNSPFFISFRVEGSNVDFETSNEFFNNQQAGVGDGNESYRANLYRERRDYPPLPTKGATSLYVPLNSRIKSNIDNTEVLVTNRSGALITANASAGTDAVSFSINRAGFDESLKAGDFIGIYKSEFNTVYWYRLESVTITSPQNFDVTVSNFPISGGTTGLFQDIESGDFAYWIQTGDNLESTGGVFYVNNQQFDFSSSETAAAYSATDVNKDTTNGRITLDSGAVTIGSSVELINISASIDYRTGMLNTDGWVYLFAEVQTSAGSSVEKVCGLGRVSALPSGTGAFVSSVASNIEVSEGNKVVLYGACDRSADPIFADVKLKVEVIG